MKLTDEMVTAIQRTYPQYPFTVADGRAQIEQMFLAGYRLGLEHMRERAADVCERTPMDQLDCATAIRSLPIEALA